MSKKDKHQKHRLSGETLAGVVVSVNRTGCIVRCDDRHIDCALLREGRRVDVVIGDRVHVYNTSSRIWSVEDVLPRKSELWRSDLRPPHDRRVIAANVDLTVIVASVHTPPLRIKLIDRCLVAAQMGGIEPLVCVNKIDLMEDEDRSEFDRLRQYSEIGISVVSISTVTGEGLDELQALMAGKTCVLIGHSGVGKSSILNSLWPDLDLATNSPRKSDGKGRHTTTASNLYELPSGISIVDTPGVREFGIHGIGAADLRECFTEFEAFAEGCSYRDCSHSTEPDCGVRRAVRDGSVSRLRYESYLRLLEDIMSGTGCPGDDSFTCTHCGALVSLEEAGTEHRNHCPRCLWSLHLDNVPGDRASCCDGQMEPVAVWVRKGGEWAVIHRCTDCGTFRSNRIAADDNEMLLLSLAARPLAQPPFPLEKITG